MPFDEMAIGLREFEISGGLCFRGGKDVRYVAPTRDIVACVINVKERGFEMVEVSTLTVR